MFAKSGFFKLPIFGGALTLGLAVVIGSIFPSEVRAQANPVAQPLKIEDVWKSPNLSGLSLSPNGRYLAATAPASGRMNLLVIDLDEKKALQLTNTSEFDVINVRWVGNSRLVFSLGQFNSPTGPGEFNGGGFFTVTRDGKESRTLSPTVKERRAKNLFSPKSLTYLARVAGSDTDIIAQGNLTDDESVDLYRLNLETGRSTLLTNGRPSSFTTSWILDNNQVPRIVSAGVQGSLTTVVYYRSDAASAWKEIARYEANKGPALVPLAFDIDNKTLQVAYNGGRKTMGVFRFNPETATVGELLAQNDQFDMGADSTGETVPGIVQDPRTGRLLGFSVEGNKPLTVWIDEARAKLQATIDAALPGAVNSIGNSAGDRQLVTSFSDVKPTRWYIYNDKEKQLTEVGTSRPWLDGKLTQMLPFTLKTRDGLEIPSYYFLPKNYKPGTKLPTIIHIHGGPFARADTWGDFGFGEREAQIFTAQGYAVIVPNFRITPGLGSKVYYSGFNAYGRQMSEDHEDAVDWGIAQGFSDPKKVCISGASYGGYAALMALAKTPGKFKCAIAGLAVTDMKYQLTSTDGDTAYSEGGVKFWKAVLGTTDLDSALAKAMSPVYLADRIKEPVFLYAGQDDIRVPIDQINRMAAELKRAGNPPRDYMIAKDEGHGFGKLENNVELYTRMLKFLSEQMK